MGLRGFWICACLLGSFHAGAQTDTTTVVVRRIVLVGNKKDQTLISFSGSYLFRRETAFR